MKNIIDFINAYGERSFSDLPWTEADALVLAQFAYYRWDTIVPDITEETQPISLTDMIANMDTRHVYGGQYNESKMKKMLEAMKNSKRYKSMLCNYYSERTCEVEETQFAAFTCILESELPVILYRGTDGTLVGWKEDFNMAFSKPIAGQYLSSFYLNHVISMLGRDVRVIGHSKGGNLGIFAAMSAPGGIRERIKEIYAFDSPGFRPELMELYRYSSISSRIRKYMPKSSLIGILLEGSNDYVSINSRAIGGFFQHNPYSWEMDGTMIKRVSGIKISSRYINKSMNQWIMGLDEEQYHMFVNTLFDVIGASGAKNINDIIDDKKDWLSSAAKMTQKLDKEQRRNIIKIIKEFIVAFQPLNQEK